MSPSIFASRRRKWREQAIDPAKIRFAENPRKVLEKELFRSRLFDLAVED